MAHRVREDAFTTQVVDTAVIYGWQWVHWRPLRTSTGWATPYAGPLGSGWPDLTLIRPKDHRQIFAELKTDTGRLTQAQENMMWWLSEALVFPGSLVQVHVWRPRNFDDIVEALK
jgi:hypothetical protein